MICILVINQRYLAHDDIKAALPYACGYPTRQVGYGRVAVLQCRPIKVIELYLSQHFPVRRCLQKFLLLVNSSVHIHFLHNDQYQ